MSSNAAERSIEHGPKVGLNNDVSSRNFFDDAYAGLSKSFQATTREVGLVTTGTVAGAVEQFRKDPVGTVERAGTTFVVGAGLGALAAAELPVISVGAVAAGAAMTGMWAWDTLNPFDARNQLRYDKIGNALRDTWHHSDSATFQRSFESMKEGAGPIALDVGLMGLGAKGAQLGGRHIPGFIKDVSALNSRQLAPATVRGYYETGPTAQNFAWLDNDFILFKTRSGRARVNAGPPETVDARLAQMDQAQGLGANAKGSVDKTPANVYRVLTPAQERTVTKSFYMGERYARQFYK
jgi:hypothetical protein